jgi:hypothetical protein
MIFISFSHDEGGAKHHCHKLRDDDGIPNSVNTEDEGQKQYRGDLKHKRAQK